MSAKRDVIFVIPKLVVSLETRDLIVGMLKLVQHDVLRNRSFCFAFAIPEQKIKDNERFENSKDSSINR